MAVATMLIFAVAAPVLAADVSDVEKSNAASASAVAAKVDALIAEHFAKDGTTCAPPARPEDFLRRATFDITGRMPTPKEYEQFVKDSAIGRAELIDRLLADPGYAENWSAYWSEVIFRHATDPRAQRARPVFDEWMADQFEQGRGWDEIATELLTATGNVRETGATALIFAHRAEGVEVAAEASRIFLGIQIQCAQCHDHPYDSWTREDFHHLVAYFPRMRVRRTYVNETGKTSKTKFEGSRRTFQVVSVNSPGRNLDDVKKRIGRLKQGLNRRFRSIDGNKDDHLQRKELASVRLLGRKAGRILRMGDADEDGGLSREEINGLSLPPAVLRANRRTEHFMPDLAHPEKPGQLMDPQFFLNDSKLRADLSDKRRRSTIAHQITDEENEWFAKAIVNRYWTELIGDGFYATVDDIGPERLARFKEVLELLADSFKKNGYDMRWLVRTITLTETYGRKVAADAPAFAAARPRRLRSNQILNAVVQVVGMGDLEAGQELVKKTVNRKRNQRGRYKTEDRFALAFSEVFGFDPSTPEEEITGDIPQALFLMNGRLTNWLSSGRDFSPVSRLLRRHRDNDEATVALFRLVLSREPTPAEREIARDYFKKASDRKTGLEDLMWVLLNSSEFLSQR